MQCSKFFMKMLLASVLPATSASCLATTLDAHSQASDCGNGVVELGEDCDSMGGSVECNDDCSFSACGDGITNPAAGEQCDDGAESPACNTDCTIAQCNDGIINRAAGEECDGDDLADSNCHDLGFEGGTLQCDDCTLTSTMCGNTPSIPLPELNISAVKQYRLEWAPVTGASHYDILESTSLEDDSIALVEGIPGTSSSHTMPLHLRLGARYRVRACSPFDCTDSDDVHVPSPQASAVGYLKAPNNEAGARLGHALALSGDGKTLAVGAPLTANDEVGKAGVVYLYIGDDSGSWMLEDTIQLINTDPDDHFGHSLALNHDGDVLAIGVPYEDSNATSINGDASNNDHEDSGAVYVYTRDDMVGWTQQAYLKAEREDPQGAAGTENETNASHDLFGWSVALSGNGDVLAAGAIDLDENYLEYPGAVYVFERSEGSWTQSLQRISPVIDPFELFGYSVALDDTGQTLAIGAINNDDVASDSGQVYIYTRQGTGAWSPISLFAPSPDPDDSFGFSLALSADGSILAVGAPGEDGGHSNVGGDPDDDSEDDAGAVYVFEHETTDDSWPLHAYVKASNPDGRDRFGHSVALSKDGLVLAVGAPRESGNAVGVHDGELTNDDADTAGAVYVYTRAQAGSWTTKAYVKASNTDVGDQFGHSVALSEDGRTLAVGAPGEDSIATDVGGNQYDNSAQSSGAVYLY